MSATVVTENAENTIEQFRVGEPGIHNLLGGYHTYKHVKPTFKTKEDERKHILRHMACVFRVFGRSGYGEGQAGHISVRDPVDPHTFWINPLGVHFSQITVSSLIHVDLYGNVLPDGNQAPFNYAGFRIHSEIHKARPDVNAACHAHSIYGKAWSSFGKMLDMINQDVCIFYKNHTVYDSFGGIVLEEKEGKRLANALGNNKAIILQNHGLLTIGETVDEAGYLFTLMEKSCQIQLQVEMACNQGLKKKIIGDEEAYYTYHNTSDPETLYAEFQVMYDLEVELSKGEFMK